MVITHRAEALAVLADTRYIPPPVRQDAPEGTLAWLRSHASRFSTGEVHARRRRLLEESLDALDPDALRDAARKLTLERDGRWEGVPVTVLGHALGVRDTGRLVEAVRAAAPGYLSGEETPEADAAVRDLLTLAADAGLVRSSVALITLLLQAHDATEGLVRNALRQAGPGDAVARLLERTLRLDPPLKVTRRMDRETGAEVRIDLGQVNRDAGAHLTFGAGVRPCPARRHAMALAEGVVAGVLGR
ncbi:hypothetical protein [Nonomuraea sp. C10]|uniref:hypothetical protein n=1 Tax=Nonomuraea sp. C10 TaxID=2600577 RepID=UPI0011CD6736|nr:hypothetical protein [Nonomuraea sp. C10]TXK42932.1 hypothetical protein FR742_28160 [Nonomuraea sp. C10]